MAESLAADIGWAPESIQKLQGIYFAIVMMLIHIVAVSGSVAMWPVREAVAVALPVPAPTPALDVANNDNTHSGVMLFPDDDAPSPGGEDDDRLRGSRKDLPASRLGPAYVAEAMQFFAEATAPAPNSRLLVTDLHEAYVQWARENGNVPMDLTPFGSCVATLVREHLFGLGKSRSKGLNYVRGRRPIVTAPVEATPLFAEAA
jgi:hypothetical protein